MNVYHIENKNLKNLESLFQNSNKTFVWSCLQGYMGDAFGDGPIHPRSVQIIIGDFCIFSGVPNEDLVKHKPKYSKSDFVIMTSENEEWRKLIENIYKDKSKKITRYSTKKEMNVFNKESLEKAINENNSNCEIKLIDETIYNKILENRWSKDLCSQFANYEDFKKRGLGVAALINEKVVSGASSYTIFKDGIEIEVDTHEDYRNKGLAYLCCCKLILECLGRNIYPSWDAHNKVSLNLSKKLGYNFDKEYDAYEIYNW